MEIKGILKERISSQSGTSSKTGNAWKTDEWLLYIPGRYERRIKFEVRGADRCKQWEDFFNGMPDKNAPVKIQFEIDAREFEGKWYNTVSAWDIATTDW